MAHRKLGFVIAGTQKGGTTTLDHLCRTHPQIQMAKVKELHFFDNEKRDWSRPDYSSLEACFSGTEGLRGESTPITMFWRPAVERLQRYNPDVRIIVSLRDPVQRALSHWRHERRAGREALAFSAAIREGRRRMDGLPETAFERRRMSYVERGFYARQLRHLLSRFPAASIHVEIFEEFVADQGAGLQRMADFLGLEPFPKLAEPAHRHRSRKTPGAAGPTPEDMALLTELFREDAGELQAMLQRPIPAWGELAAAADASASR